MSSDSFQKTVKDHGPPVACLYQLILLWRSPESSGALALRGLFLPWANPVSCQKCLTCWGLLASTCTVWPAPGPSTATWKRVSDCDSFPSFVLASSPPVVRIWWFPVPPWVQVVVRTPLRGTTMPLAHALNPAHPAPPTCRRKGTLAVASSHLFPIPP